VSAVALEVKHPECHLLVGWVWRLRSWRRVGSGPAPHPLRSHGGWGV